MRENQQKEVWVIWLGNPIRVPYYVGRNKPVAVWVENASQFATELEARAYLEAWGCPGIWTGFPVRVV